MRSSRLGRNDDGQIFPLVLVAAVGLLALGFALFQVGRGTDYKARAQTGADAAALAGAEALRHDLLGVLTIGLAPSPTPTPTTTPSPGRPGKPGKPGPPAKPTPTPTLDLGQLTASLISAAAADYASRNDTVLVGEQFDLATLTVRVEVQTKGALTGIGAGSRGTAEARAQLILGGSCLPAAGGGASLPVPSCAPGESPVLGDLVGHVRLVG